MTGGIDPGLEIRRILLLTFLRQSVRGKTLEQLVKECRKVAGWATAGKAGTEVVLSVIQSLLDDGLLALRQRFVITVKGRQYLEDPAKWQIDRRTSETVEGTRLLLKAVYSNVNKVVRQIRSKASLR